MDKERMHERLDKMWRSGSIEKQDVPFIRTAINRPLWTAWHLFIFPAAAKRDPRALAQGMEFLACRFRGSVLIFLHRYFPGLIMFPYFENIWFRTPEEPARIRSMSS